MTRNGDGLFPIPDGRKDSIDKNGGAENRAIQNGADRAVRTFPHGVKVVFRHPLGVGRDGGAFYAYAVFPDGFRRVQRDLIGCAVAFRQAEIKIDGFQIDERLQQFFLDLFPENSGHFVSVQFNKRRFHLNFLHAYPPLQCCG